MLPKKTRLASLIRHLSVLSVTFIPTTLLAFEGDAIDFHGYARSGIGASGSGGNQVAFQAKGAGTKYRLGNETDTFAEIGLGAELFNNGTQSFKLDSLIAYGTDQANNWEATTPSLSQINAQAKGVLSFSPEAVLWVGKRYYKRMDVHMSDFYYLNTSGPGAGIENVNFGFAEGSLAWIRSTSEIEYYRDPQHATDRNHVNKYSLAQNVVDFRLEKIETNPNGSLMIGVNYAFGSPSDPFEGGWIADEYEKDGTPKIKAVAPRPKSEMEENGYMLTAQHTQVGFLGGGSFNAFVLQYAADAMTKDAFGTNGGGVSAFKADNLSGNKLYRVLDHGSISLTDDIDMLYKILYSHVSYKDSTKKDQDWFSLGVRPMYYWSDIMSTAIELGFDNVTNAVGEGSDKASQLTKMTLAQQWSAGRGALARPQIRTFLTYAMWNDDSKGSIGGKTYASDTSGFTFGVQMEAWW